MKNNKIIKYLKSLITLAIIFAFTFQNFAALSDSDGGSFVTKAEFDSALADFNSRLTTFETGINSKIDSQVTSYLDRNGIWNGKTQTIIDANKSWTYGIKSAATYTSTHSWYIHHASGVEDPVGFWRFRTMNMAGLQTYNSSTYNAKLIDQFDKSGLACVIYDVTNVTGGIACYITGWDGATTEAGDHFKCMYTAEFSLLQDNTDQKSSLFTSLNQSCAAARLQVNSFQTTPMYFFVEKGKSLYVKGVETLALGDGSVYSMTVSALATNNKTYRTITIKSVSIY